MEYLILGMALAFNVLIVIWKLKRNRIADGILDASLLILVAIVFSGSTATLIIGTIGSMFISLYLLAFPVKLNHATVKRI